jgi:hypothetical protein
LRSRSFPPPHIPPAACTVEKLRGRIEIRELWLVPAGALGPYLADVWRWQDVAHLGWVRRQRQVRRGAAWTEERVTVVTSLSPTAADPTEILRLVRGHWVIENRVHYVRDGTYGEDRLHGRQRGQVLAGVRNTAMSVFRWRGFRYIPDGRRWASAHLDATMRWLL